MNKDRSARRQAAASVIAAAVVLLWIGIEVAILIWAQATAPMPLGLWVLILGIPALVCGGILMALVQRLREIRRGEADEARKY